ncbi:conjugal transfer protein [Pectobacterium carotovorum]|uniref:conjugal transfer protein n=1 Tax=Pectobacterium carotovorum TaxID=554 RepID=UPI0019353197|nr:conjugal transfer protein [Pectobacterium versatile]
MRYITLKAGLLFGFVLFSAASIAETTCRAGSAAQAGSQAGYERSRAAATAWSQRESNVSSSLQSCLSRIKKITVTVPEFPNLSDLLSQLENEICDAAVDKVNQNIPSNIDPWKDYSNRL